MKLAALADYLENELAYPIDQASVVEQIGATEIDAPNRAETATISVILGAVDAETYDSSEELFETIIGNVSDEYIGRKFYDDRGGNPPETTSEPTDEADVSF